MMMVALSAGSVSAGVLPAGWATGDIGATGAEGSASGSEARLTISGAGLDVWGTADQFHFTYRTLTGDGAIVARVAGADAIAAWTKVGVMMRETLAPGSKHAFMIVSPGKGLAFQHRVSTGGLSTHTAGGAGVAPYWVRIERAGTTFTASRSLDGTSWTVVGTQTIAMPPTIYVGLAVGSHVTGVLARATFESVSVINTLPTGWASRDIGQVGALGSAAHASGSFVVNGAGLDVWGTADQFRFVYKTLSGDGAVVARVSSLENVSAWTKAGVMMRESLEDNAKHAFMLVSPGKGLAFQRRPTTGGTSVNTSGGSGTSPRYVKIERQAGMFTASQSPDGVAWTVVGTHSINMPSTIYVGIAVGSHVTGVLADAVFENVAVTAGLGAASPEPPIDSDPEPPQDPVIDPLPVLPATTLRVLTWNTRHGGTRADGVYDPDNTANWIVKMSPDIASLNEFDNATQANKIVSLLEAKTGVAWNSHYDNGNLIVSRLDVLGTDICLVNAAANRRASFMSVMANGRTISLYAAHLTVTNSERKNEVIALQACAANKAQNRILAGDFNMQAGTDAYVQAMIGHTDAWKVAKALGAAVNYPGNCDGCTRNSRIDYVFTSAGATGIALKSAEIVDTRNTAGVMASDHKPMLVVYELK
jgi:endonuclease/exonuclease/phosphatase family metal-dependent hydrolase